MLYFVLTILCLIAVILLAKSDKRSPKDINDINNPYYRSDRHGDDD